MYKTAIIYILIYANHTHGSLKITQNNVHCQLYFFPAWYTVLCTASADLNNLEASISVGRKWQIEALSF